MYEVFGLQIDHSIAYVPRKVELVLLRDNGSPPGTKVVHERALCHVLCDEVGGVVVQRHSDQRYKVYVTQRSRGVKREAGATCTCTCMCMYL